MGGARMESDLEAFVQEISGEIREEMQRAYGEEALERWERPRFMGRMNNPDGAAEIHGSCGDTMGVFLRFENEIVAEASFVTDGCGSSMACGSIAAEMAHGRTPDELLDITPESIRERAGGRPKEDEPCPSLAVTTLHEALNDYMKKRVHGDR